MAMTLYESEVPFRLTWKHVVSSLIFVTILKVLLIPSYRSTDFDVHRNWLAITHHLPLKEWYFDNVNGGTVHTLDYPPSFAYFEYLLSNNPVTNWLVYGSGVVDERCLALLPDRDNSPSPPCVVFHRMTVILSDVVLWIGSFVASKAMYPTSISKQRWTFMLIIFNPGLIWLDHIHFQYNGMLLGLLLASLGLLIQGSRQPRSSFNHDIHHLLSAILFALLLTMKHLYLTLAPIYFVYLLSQYCINGSSSNSFIIRNFVLLAGCTGGTLILPFVPFLSQGDSVGQMTQIISRLFPFGRGLVHDYWAANVWALWMLSNKILGFVGRTLDKADDERQFQLPHLTPGIVASVLFTGLTPGLYYAWEASSRKLVQCVVYCALASFMLAWHVHEKAIMTALIPMTMLALTSKEQATLFLRMSVLGLFGLFPLLFRPVELSVKVLSYFAYLMLCLVCFEQHHIQMKLSLSDKLAILVLGIVGVFLEVLHPLLLYPRMEFLPLLLTSVTCAIGLIVCWYQSFNLMARRTTLMGKRKVT